MQLRAIALNLMLEPRALAGVDAVLDGEAELDPSLRSRRYDAQAAEMQLRAIT